MDKSTFSDLSPRQQRDYLTGEVLNTLLRVDPAWINVDNRDTVLWAIDKFVATLFGSCNNEL